MERPSSPSKSYKSAALALVGLLIGGMIFVLGFGIGAMLSHPGGLLADGLSRITERSAAGTSEAGLGTDVTGKASAESTGNSISRWSMKCCAGCATNGMAICHPTTN